MMYIEFYALIIPQFLLEDKYRKGKEEFKLDIPTDAVYQHDYQLSMVRFLKLDQALNFATVLKEKGFHYDEDQFFSSDFVIFSQLGLSWTVKWLAADLLKCWLAEPH